MTEPDNIRSEGQPHASAEPRRFCGACGAVVPVRCEACLVCGEPYSADNGQPAFPPRGERVAPQRYEAVPAARHTPQRWRRWLGNLSVVITLMVVLLGGTGLYRQYFDTSSYRAADVILYENAGGLELFHPGLEQPVVLSGMVLTGDSLAGALATSPNGRWICYAVQSELYLLDLAQIADDRLDAQLIAANVVQPAYFSADNRYLVYLRQSGELYASDMENSWRLDSQVREIVAVEGGRVLYTRQGDHGEAADLFLNDLKQDGGEWLTIDREITEVLDWTPNFERIFYLGTRQDEAGSKVPTLQLFELFDQGKSTTTTLATSIGRVLDVSAEKGTAMYLVRHPHSFRYEQFIDDDLREADLAVTEPDVANYPALEAAIALYGEGGEFTDSEDNEELIEQNAAYTEALAAWDEKLTRDEMRSRIQTGLQQNSAALTLWDLYTYKNGEVLLLDSYVWLNGTPEEGAVSAEKEYVAYERIDPDSLQPVKLSVLWEAEESWAGIVDYFLRHTRRELQFATIGSEPIRIFLRSENNMFYQWRVSPNGDGIYFLTAADQDGPYTLYHMSTKSAGEASIVERDVMQIDDTLRDGILFSAQRGAETQMYFARGRNAQMLGRSNVVVLGIVGTGNSAILYLDGYVPSEKSGTLWMLARDERMIADSVADAAYYRDDLIYLLRPGETGLDLYVWNGESTMLIARDVDGVSTI